MFKRISIALILISLSISNLYAVSPTNRKEAPSKWLGDDIALGRAPDGTFHYINVDALGNVISVDFLIEVAKGNVPGHSAVNKFGHNSAVSTTGEDVWAAGGTYNFYPTIAQSMEILSSSSSDDSGGTGAIQVTVLGLDENWDEQTETITLNGTSAVTLANTYIRMFRAFVAEAGSSNSNVGDISVRISGGGTTAIYISATDGQTQQAIYTIPNGKTGYFITGYTAVADDDKNGEVAEFKWLIRTNNGVNGAWLTKGQIALNNIGSSTWQYKYGIPAGPIPEKTDIRINCFRTTDIVGVVGGFDLLLVEDGY